MPENRRCHRLRVAVPLMFELVKGEKIVESVTLDVSGTGFSFKIKDIVKVGDIFNFIFKLEKMRTIEIDATVVWVRKKWQGVHQEVYVGAKVIDELDQDKIEYVRFIVEKMKEYVFPRQDGNY